MLGITPEGPPLKWVLQECYTLISQEYVWRGTLLVAFSYQGFPELVESLRSQEAVVNIQDS